MSRASKLTLLGSILFTTTVIGGVHYMANNDFEARRVGIYRDMEKRAQRSESQIENELEYQRQEELRRQLEKDQPVTGPSFLEKKKSSNSTS